MKCPRCGEEVKCDLHGDGWVRMDFSFGLESLPFFWCDKCFEESMSVFGSVIHDHFVDFVAGVSKDEGFKFAVTRVRSTKAKPDEKRDVGKKLLSIGL